MDAKTCIILFLVIPFGTCQWRQSHEERSLRDARKGIHYVAKRHMLPREAERRRIATTQRAKDTRKKPSGHLRPLNEDDIENDEVVSVAIGPPATRPKYDKFVKPIKPNATARSTNYVKDVLVQLGREFLTHKVSEDFVFGQYVGNAMKNLTADLKIKMQHDILELIMRYQKMSTGETPHVTTDAKGQIQLVKKMEDRRLTGNETEEGWPDFSNFAKIVA